MTDSPSRLPLTPEDIRRLQEEVRRHPPNLRDRFGYPPIPGTRFEDLLP